MGYVEMIKDTENGKVAKWINAEGEMVIEPAAYCDECYKYRPASKVITTFLVDNDWIQVCVDCRQ